MELIADRDHLDRIVLHGMLAAKVSLDIMTADFKAMLVPDTGALRGKTGRSRSATSIVDRLAALAARGVEVRLLHSGVPSGPALRQLRQLAPDANLTIRRCPRLHAKTVVIDSRAMYLGSANMTGAGLGAKSAKKRNFELGVWTTSPALIDAVMLRFNHLWEGGQCPACGRRGVCPVPLEEPHL